MIAETSQQIVGCAMDSRSTADSRGAGDAGDYRGGKSDE